MSGTPEHVRARIVDYYVLTTERSYLANWSGESLGLHCGMADETTKSLSESLDNTNAFLAERAGITAGTRVLDAGCGVGGSSLWLARHKGARVTGISIVPRQVEIARQFARERGLEALVDFRVADMALTNFPPGSFDVVWNLESMCHAVDLGGYVAHAGELLRDGGRLAVIDICRGPVANAELESVVADGWVLAPLRTADEIAAALERSGFREITTADVGPRLELSNRALEAKAVQALLLLRSDALVAGRAPEPRYEAHVRAALAFVRGMREQAFSMIHILAVRRARADGRGA
jgi:cyclopropane fatty-acyl-phospholipid synthase-like methyltransferase